LPGGQQIGLAVAEIGAQPDKTSLLVSHLRSRHWSA
jgi:hypothetical protein